jgi:hypothetical protein
MAITEFDITDTFQTHVNNLNNLSTNIGDVSLLDSDVVSTVRSATITPTSNVSAADFSATNNPGFIGNLQGNITGNAATVTNGVYTTDSGTVTNTMLANSSTTIGTTAISLGSSSTTLAGLSSVTSTNFVGNLTGNVTGNASTATTAGKWTTARTITLGGDLSGNVSIDGSANVTLNATFSGGGITLGTNTTGNYVAAGVTFGNGISGSVSSEGGTFTVTSNATAANTANTIVYRDANGDFAAGDITVEKLTLNDVAVTENINEKVTYDTSIGLSTGISYISQPLSGGTSVSFGGLETAFDNARTFTWIYPSSSNTVTIGSVNGTSVTVNWLNGEAPNPTITSGGFHVYTFTIIRVNTAGTPIVTVLGSFSEYDNV